MNAIEAAGTEAEALRGVGVIAVYTVRHVINIAQSEFAMQAGLSSAWLAAAGMPLLLAIVSPSTAEFHLSVSILLMVVIGALGSVWSAVAGAFLVQFLGEGMRDVILAIFPSTTGEVQLLGYGIVLIMVILLLPGGLHQAAPTLWQKLSIAGKCPPGDAHARAPEADTTIPQRPQLPQLPAVSTPVAAGQPILVLEGLTH